VERLAAAGALVSVDTWRAPVARAALEAGAAMINDVSGLSDEGVAAACADSGAALVVTHTRSAPKTKAFPRYDDVVADVRGFLAERMAAAEALGVERDRVVLDPGLDLAKSPAESIEVLRRLPEIAALGAPLLLAVSRKDFVGAVTERPPSGRDPGTLAAMEAAVSRGGHIIRIHDVAGAHDYLRVREALADGADAELRLAPELRREAV
jgi:dihydropteroate synthase